MPLEELEYDFRTQTDPNAAGPDKAIAIRFYMDALPDEEKSLQEGRPIFRDVEMIEKRVRGDRNNIVCRPVMPEDQRMYRDLYRAFKEDREAPMTGTPLHEWPGLPKSLILELNHMGFRTVEDVSEATESVMAKMAGLRSVSQKAKHWLELAKSNAPLEQMSHKITEQDNVIETQNRQIAELRKIVDDLQAKAAKAPEKHAG